jgi:hypothetical protein
MTYTLLREQAAHLAPKAGVVVDDQTPQRHGVRKMP